MQLENGRMQKQLENGRMQKVPRPARNGVSRLRAVPQVRLELTLDGF